MICSAVVDTGVDYEHEDLKDIIAMLGPEELSREDQRTVKRARRLAARFWPGRDPIELSSEALQRALQDLREALPA